MPLILRLWASTCLGLNKMPHASKRHRTGLAGNLKTSFSSGSALQTQRFGALAPAPLRHRLPGPARPPRSVPRRHPGGPAVRHSLGSDQPAGTTGTWWRGFGVVAFGQTDLEEKGFQMDTVFAKTGQLCSATASAESGQGQRLPDRLLAANHT